jgi:hypothetical protein
MSSSFLSLVLTLGIGQTAGDEPRPRHPLAPSLPLLSPKEEAKYEAILERFIQYDIGKLRGAPGKKALEDFNMLPPEAIFVLIDGFNRTANLEASCPAVVIGKKIVSILSASNDLELLTFAKENLGAGVTAKRHLGMLKDVQFSILLRKGAVQRKLAVAGTSGSALGPKSLSSMPLADLVKAVDTKKGQQLKPVLMEIERRQGPKVVEALAVAAADADKEIQALALGLLAKHVSRLTGAQLKNLLKHERPEVKAQAAKEIGTRGLRYGGELVDLLQESDPSVHQAARAALRQLGRDVDFGPEPDASTGDREAAQRRWREWWTKQPR